VSFDEFLTSFNGFLTFFKSVEIQGEKNMRRWRPFVTLYNKESNDKN